MSELLRLPDVYEFVRQRHQGQEYCGMPFHFHLERVVEQLIHFGFTSYSYLAAGLLHDVIEDTPTTREEIGERFGGEVEMLVWAVTGIGKNRKARNADQYAKLQAFPKACVLKVADRLANHAASLREPKTEQPNYSFMRMYLREREEFEAVVRPYIPSAMWEALQKSYADLATELTRNQYEISA